jgi:hypothetical protein
LDKGQQYGKGLLGGKVNRRKKLLGQKSTVRKRCWAKGQQKRMEEGPMIENGKKVSL